MFFLQYQQKQIYRARQNEVIHIDLTQIDFSAVFDSVSHFGLLYNLRDLGIGGAVFDVIAGFLTGTVEMVVVDGIRSENVSLISGDLRVVCWVP